MPDEHVETHPTRLPFGGASRWIVAAIPLLLLGLVLLAFVLTSPLASIPAGEPLPDVTVTHHTIPDDDTIVLYVTNNGPESVTISQVLVDEAYWNFEVHGAGGDATLEPLESARVEIPYHWNPGWDLHVDLVLDNGATFGHVITAPQESPTIDTDLLWMFVEIGLFVGVIPIVLGMLWFPFIRDMSATALHAVLVFSMGVLSFLAFDAAFEAFALVERIPGAYEGELLVVTGLVGALLLIQSVSAWRESRTTDGESASGLWLAYLVALGIGLHNLAEGLAIGSSFALGRVSLGTFLVIGFMIHNVTEGPPIVAPLARGARPKVRHFAMLGVVAGAPVIAGGWIGSMAYSPVVGAFFLAVGVGAILQVDWEIAGLVRHDGARLITAPNLLAFLAGFAVMYLTDLLIVL